MSKPQPRYVHLDDHLLPAARAQISVFDRGLLYGDGLFETLRIYRGRPFGLTQHLARLRASAHFLGIPIPRRPWRTDLEALLRRNRLSAADAWVRITVTRGAASSRLLPPPRMHATVLIMAGHLDPALAAAQQHGARVVLAPFARDGFLAEHKVLSFLPAILARKSAARHGAFEALFVAPDGSVTEGATSNVFAWYPNELVTPPVRGILPGITRRIVLQAAMTEGMRVSERPLTVRELLSADEAFLTSSLAEIVPVLAVDTRAIGTGRVGPRTRHMLDLYRQIVDHALPSA